MPSNITSGTYPMLKNMDASLKQKQYHNSHSLQRTINEFNGHIASIQRLNSIHQSNSNQQYSNEYYLTDIIELLSNAGKTISGHCIDTVYEVLGANTQDELNALNQQAISLAQSHTI